MPEMQRKRETDFVCVCVCVCRRSFLWCWWWFCKAELKLVRFIVTNDRERIERWRGFAEQNDRWRKGRKKKEERLTVEWMAENKREKEIISKNNLVRVLWCQPCATQARQSSVPLRQHIDWLTPARARVCVCVCVSVSKRKLLKHSGLFKES